MKKLAALVVVLLVALAPTARAQQYPPQECPGNVGADGECPGNSEGQGPGNGQGNGNGQGGGGGSTGGGAGADAESPRTADEGAPGGASSSSSDPVDVVIVLGSGETAVVQPGDVIALSADGFEPGEQVNVTLESTPILVATPTATSAGSISALVTIPADFPPGQHTLRAVGQRSGHMVVSSIEVVAVSGAAGAADDNGLPGVIGDLPRTGAGIATLLVLAVASLIVGALSVRRSRALARG